MGDFKWIDVKKELPTNEDGKWSKSVAALCDNGKVYRLSCMGGYWQRSKEFVDSGANEVHFWINLPENYTY